MEGGGKNVITKAAELLRAGCHDFVRNALNIACCAMWSDLGIDRFPADLFHSFCPISGN